MKSKNYNLGHNVVAFSTQRQGGHSEGAYGEFNINRYCGDSDEHIRLNREDLCTKLGISDDRLIMPHQVHLTESVFIDEDFLMLSPEEKQLALEGKDAIMTDLSNVCIGVSTADCIPILLYDEEHHAIAAVHAGWRGTVARIAEKIVAEMQHIYRSRPQHLRAVIGPGISLESFEVGDEVYDAFCAAGFSMEPISRRYPATDIISRYRSQESNTQNENNGKWHIDLFECNRLQLIAAGLSSANIHVDGTCTFLHPDLYFSARRLGIKSGRVFTGIMLRRNSETVKVC